MMENPEDVLQALDEFQKMRPTEIPKVLEEYLTWVAKTGEPLYQWSLIKTLFREKLLRVMNEFCESGNPSLLGPPPPNVEPFNYENMKGSLLDRLENFSNPPFTVQRICELLIAPRREYNRIDKYMRAVEKNILVVSTKEPGAFGRRSENGDSLVNGSVEDETSHHGQSSNDVDMENWVKDCTGATPTALHATTNEDMAVDNELKSFEKHERIEQLTPIDATASSYITSAVDFQVAATMPTQIPAPEVSAVVHNLTAIGGEAPVLADVDAIMNEDTSSQPSLELESDENDSNDSKKLPTSFETKDFNIDDNKLTDLESQDIKSEENLDNSGCDKEGELIQTLYTEPKQVSESSNETADSVRLDSLGAIVSEPEHASVTVESLVCEKSDNDSNDCSEGFHLTNNEIDLKQNDSININIITENKEESIDLSAVVTEKKDECKTESVIQENKQESICLTTEPSEEISSEVSKPIIEEPSQTINSENSEKPECTKLTIQEVVENDTSAKTIVPDPVPVIEEPKDTESETNSNVTSVIPEELVSVPIEEPQSVIITVNNGLEESQVATEQKEDNQVVAASCEEIISTKIVESMDVDNNDSSAVSTHQDEPMEQELTEAISS